MLLTRTCKSTRILKSPLVNYKHKRKCPKDGTLYFRMGNFWGKCRSLVQIVFIALTVADMLVLCAWFGFRQEANSAIIAC